MTEQEFLAGLTPQQSAYFSARLITLQSELQANCAASVCKVVESCDAKENELNGVIDRLAIDLTSANDTIADRDATIWALEDRITKLESNQRFNLR